MLYKVVLKVETVNLFVKCTRPINVMKATELHFSVVMFVSEPCSN